MEPKEERQGRSGKTAEHHGTGFESRKLATECLKQPCSSKGGTLREAIGHQAQSPLVPASHCSPKARLPYTPAEEESERAILGEQWVLMPNRVC